LVTWWFLGLTWSSSVAAGAMTGVGMCMPAASVDIPVAQWHTEVEADTAESDKLRTSSEPNIFDDL
jgi:hypothetical protein